MQIGVLGCFCVMGKIIRYCKLNEERFGENVFDVSRPNIFGNPYTHIGNRKTLADVKVSTRDEAIDLYSDYFDEMLKDETAAGEIFRKEWDRMYEAYKTFDEIYLGCYCQLDERCHSDIIRKKLIQRSMKEKLSQLKRDRNVKKC